MKIFFGRIRTNLILQHWDLFYSGKPQPYPQILDYPEKTRHVANTLAYFRSTVIEENNVMFLSWVYYRELKLTFVNIIVSMENLMVIRVEVIVPEEPLISKHLQK